MQEKSFIEFYGENGISLVRQDISDIQKHFTRRNWLYRHLGIPTQSIKGKKVLEIGPGSGYNPIFTASLSPEEYHLVVGNSEGVRQMKELFNKYKYVNNYTIYDSS